MHTKKTTTAVTEKSTNRQNVILSFEKLIAKYYCKYQK